jgi:hypothetical protein
LWGSDVNACADGTRISPFVSYKADFILFGGSRKQDHPGFYLERKWKRGFDVDAPASRLSHRITVSWTRASSSSPWQYRFSSWTTEDMGYPRVMPDATLLPNGDVVLLSGAQVRDVGPGWHCCKTWLRTPMALVATCKLHARSHTGLHRRAWLATLKMAKPKTTTPPSGPRCTKRLSLAE